MKKANRIFIALLALVIYSCDDIIEEDISNDSIQTISPIEGAIIEGNTVQFSWQQLDGADDYRIQIINNNQALILDSLATSSMFNYSLNPGNYQWRVKGENFAYTTQYTFPINFSVEASDNLINQNIILSTPSNNLYTNDTDIILTWQEIIGADYYDLEVAKLFGGEQTVLQETNITSTSFNLQSDIFDEDAEYQWKIKAVNASSQTNFSERSIFLDRQAPNQPVLVSPNDQETSTSFTTNFNWTNGTDMGNVQSALTTTFEISTDINFGSLLVSEDLQNNSYQYIFDVTGVYYWRVINFDEAGNIGDYSAVHTLTIE
jgi:hypothetical protein